MALLKIFLAGDGMLEGIPRENVIIADNDIKIGGLAGGMTSGKPSISFAITLPDGKVVFAETSMRLFHTAAKAFASKYGWQDDSDFVVVDGINRV
jgi:hypothetical protein